MSGTLQPLATGVVAWLADAPDHDEPNMGAIVADDGITVVDSATTPDQAAPFIQALAELSPLPIRRLALSTSHIGHVGGSSAFPLAAVYGSGQTSHLLDQPANPAVWEQLHRPHAHAFADLTTRPVSHTVAEPAHLCAASIAVPVSGQQFENLVVQVPGANVVFLGALASFGVTPLGFEADLPSWIQSLEQCKGWGELFVPGHGPIGGHEEVTVLQEYLQACIDAKGSRAGLANGPWQSWSNPEFHAVNVERAHMLATGDPSPPPSMLALLGM
jgi:glyoxylase-like metal-dependent hydrolase (beta-lactamase superfamily II)